MVSRACESYGSRLHRLFKFCWFLFPPISLGFWAHWDALAKTAAIHTSTRSAGVIIDTVSVACSVQLRSLDLPRHSRPKRRERSWGRG